MDLNDRCPDCGQYRDPATHICPERVDEREYHRDGLSLTVPHITAIRDHLRENPAGVPVGATVRDPTTGAEHQIAGQVILERPTERGSRAEVTQAQLDCSCGQPSCAHRDLAAAELVDRVNSPRVTNPTRIATARVLDRLGIEHDESTRAQATARDTWPERSAPGYSEDFASFQDAYREARQRRARGEDPVPYLTENATGGLGARDGGRGFGVELEFDLPTHYTNAERSRAVTTIARELHTAGLSQTDRMLGYHSGRGRDLTNYSDAPNTWRIEHDGTVDGEVVSPILYDTPETWRNLRTVCDIIRRNGGAASISTGSHVHVSVGDYDHTVDNHNRLLNLFAGYEDTLYRLAQNPAAQRHRGTSYCRPNTVPSGGYESVTAASLQNLGHSIGLNLGSVRGEAHDHAEFRMWDGSLDPGTIQTQIKLSLGLAHAAFRTAGRPAARPTEREPVGTHHRTHPPDDVWGRRRRLSGQEWRESTRTFRGLADTLFHRDADRAQATSLFAVTRWQR